MRKYTAAVAAALIVALLLSACTFLLGESPDGDGDEYASREAGNAEPLVLPDPSAEGKEASGQFNVTTADGKRPTVSGSVYTITGAGTYTLSGKLEEGRVVVNADDSDKVTLVLSGVSISSSAGAPISAVSADSLTIKVSKGTYNTVTDNRGTAEADTDEANAAIFADCDLTMSGTGTLIVTGNCDHGIKSKDDVEISEVTLKISAEGNALRGNDSVSVKSGSLILISAGGDGLKTTGSDISKKGVQRGTVAISGGSVDIYAAKDGISAAYDVVITGEDTAVNIFTSDYSEYAGDVSVAKTGFLIVPTSMYSNLYDYYARFFNADGSQTWAKCTYSTPVYSGRTAYYGLSLKMPTGFTGVQFGYVNSGTVPNGGNFLASTAELTVSDTHNAYTLSSSSGGRLSGSWVSLNTGSSGSGKTDYSSKGIKCYNDISISGGTVIIMSKDDGLHANAGEALENGSVGTGNIYITGGNLTVTASDDGIHADGAVTISGGYVNVAEAYEGMEANVVNIAGGTVFIYGRDDGINAQKGTATPLINITGGYLDVTTTSGDTDAIDSNGNFTMSGGFVIVKGGNSSGGVAGSVDVDGSITVTGGAIVALGGICETPSAGSVNTYVSRGTGFSAGKYTLTDASGEVLVSFTLSAGYTSCWIAADTLALNGSYTLSRDGTAVLTWEQTSATVGASGSQGGTRPGGQGGFGPGGRR